MGAYYQNQVISKDKKTGEEFTLVVDGGSLKFMETQYALNNTMKNVVRELSTKTSEDNPALVFCVCDYDKQEDDRYVQEWLEVSTYGSDLNKVVKRAVRVLETLDEYGDPEREIVENSRFVSGKENIRVEGLFTGFVVCKSTKEYLDIDKIRKLAEELHDEHSILLISPIALLTRKNKEGMGGGDLGELTYADGLSDYLTKWYEEPIYWSSERPSDEFEDITLDTAYIETTVEETQISDTGKEYTTNYCYITSVY